jgi:hypothetical protein
VLSVEIFGIGNFKFRHHRLSFDEALGQRQPEAVGKAFERISGRNGHAFRGLRQFQRDEIYGSNSLAV